MAKIDGADHRLAVLKLARDLNSVSEACRLTKMNRNSFYFWKKRFNEEGIDGLKIRCARCKWHHPKTTSEENVKKILMIARSCPEYGCNRLQKILQNEGIQISATTIQKILKRAGIGFREQRLRY